MIWFNRFYNWFPLVAIFCFCAIMASQSIMHKSPPAEAMRSPRALGAARTICDAGAWVPADFFHQENILKICQAISRRDYKQLDQLLKKGDSLNDQGKSGVTVLHWAYFERDETAFKMLLEAGASPDIVFTADVENSFHPFGAGSTLALDSMQHRFYGLPFFELTLPYIRQPNQKAPYLEYSLLHAFIYNCFGSSAPSSCDTVRQIIATGVDLNAQDNIGATAAQMALGFDMPDECLIMLEAGTDPNNQNLKGKSLRDTLQAKLAGDQTTISGRSLTSSLRAIEAWLSAFDSKHSQTSSATQ